MTDPREEKLPKWARDLLHEERLKNALRFPDRPAPEADFTGPHYSNLPILEWIYSENAAGIFSHYVGRYGTLFSSEEASGFGYRPSGEYFSSVENARLSMRWRMARKFAEELLRAETDGVRK